MSQVEVALRRPFRAPYERIHVALEDGDRFIFRPKKGSRLCLPADYANQKLINWNQSKALLYGRIYPSYGDVNVRQMTTTFINSGSSVVFHRLTDYLVLPGFNGIFGGIFYTLDKTLHKYSMECILDNDREESNSSLTDGQSDADEICVYDDTETFWTAYAGGTGSYAGTLSEETTQKIKGTSSLKLVVGAGAYADVGWYHNYVSGQNWSAKEFICFYHYGVNNGRTWRLTFWCPDYNNRYDYTFVDNFSGWKRFVVPLAKFAATGSPSWSNVVQIFWYYTPTATDTYYFDRTVVDVGQWVRVETYVPDVLATGATATQIMLRSWDGSSYVALMRWDAYGGSVGYNWNNSGDGKGHLLDGTRLWEIYGNLKGNAGYFLDKRGITKTVGFGDSNAGNITYSSYYGCISRVGFAIKMPPDDGQDSSTYGISQIRLKLEVYYEGVTAVKDLSEKCNHGTRYGALEAIGGIGKGLLFDGIDDFVDCGNGLSLRFTTAFTLDILVKMPMPATSMYFLSKGRVGWTAPYNGYQIYYNRISAGEGYFSFDVADVDTPIDNIAWRQNPSVVDNVWYHLIATFEDGLMNLYESDILRATKQSTTVTNVNATINNLRLGVYSQSLQGFLNGQEGEVRLFNRALSATERTDLFNWKDPRLISGLVGYWGFEDDWDFGRTTYEFENSTNQYYGLQNLNDSWLALFDPTTRDCEFLVLSRRPTGLKVRADENEDIDQIELTLAKGTVVHAGMFVHGDLTRDSDGDGVPDFIEGGSPDNYESNPNLADGQADDDEVCLYDDTETFWTFGQAIGGNNLLGAGSFSEELTIKVKGASSGKLNVPSGTTYQNWWIGHVYPSAQDWSSKEFLCLYWYGDNAGKTISIQAWNTPNNGAKHKEIIINWSGWKRLVIPLNTFLNYGTNPSFGDVKYIAIAAGNWWGTENYATTSYLDRTVVDISSHTGLQRLVGKRDYAGWP